MSRSSASGYGFAFNAVCRARRRSEHDGNVEAELLDERGFERRGLGRGRDANTTLPLWIRVCTSVNPSDLKRALQLRHRNAIAAGEVHAAEQGYVLGHRFTHPFDGTIRGRPGLPIAAVDACSHGDSRGLQQQRAERVTAAAIGSAEHRLRAHRRPRPHHRIADADALPGGSRSHDGAGHDVHQLLRHRLAVLPVAVVDPPRAVRAQPRRARQPPAERRLRALAGARRATRRRSRRGCTTRATAPRCSASTSTATRHGRAARTYRRGGTTGPARAAATRTPSTTTSSTRTARSTGTARSRPTISSTCSTEKSQRLHQARRGRSRSSCTSRRTCRTSPRRRRPRRRQRSRCRRRRARRRTTRPTSPPSRAWLRDRPHLSPALTHVHRRALPPAAAEHARRRGLLAHDRRHAPPNGTSSTTRTSCSRPTTASTSGSTACRPASRRRSTRTSTCPLVVRGPGRRRRRRPSRRSPREIDLAPTFAAARPHFSRVVRRRALACSRARRHDEDDRIAGRVDRALRRGRNRRGAQEGAHAADERTRRRRTPSGRWARATSGPSAPVRVPSAEATVAIPAYKALRTERYLYAEYATGEKQLYDIQRDPDELHNLAAVAPRSLLAILAERLHTLARCRAASCS